MVTLSMEWLLCPVGYFRQEDWRGLLFLLQRPFPTQRSDSASLASPTLATRFYHCATWEALQLPIILEQTCAWHLFTSQEAAVWEAASFPEGWLHMWQSLCND